MHRASSSSGTAVLASAIPICQAMSPALPFGIGIRYSADTPRTSRTNGALGEESSGMFLKQSSCSAALAFRECTRGCRGRTMQQRFNTRNYSVRDFEEWNDKGELTLAPKFQRREVWK